MKSGENKEPCRLFGGSPEPPRKEQFWCCSPTEMHHTVHASNAAAARYCRLVRGGSASRRQRGFRMDSPAARVSRAEAAMRPFVNILCPLVEFCSCTACVCVCVCVTAVSVQRCARSLSRGILSVRDARQIPLPSPKRLTGKNVPRPQEQPWTEKLEGTSNGVDTDPFLYLLHPFPISRYYSTHSLALFFPPLR